MSKHKVRLEPIGVECEVAHGASLHDILATYGIEFPCGGNGICGNCKVRLLDGRIDRDLRHKQLLKQRGLGDEWRLACLSQVTNDLCIFVQQCETIIQTDDTPFDFFPEEGYGIAVDLGSTTIVSQLVNLSNGQIEAVSTDINPQSRYGADIISRIGYAMKSEEHRLRLQQLVRDSIYHQLSNLVSQRNCDLRKVMIVGNTVMHHLFCGIDVSPLATFPFQSTDNIGRIYCPEELGWELPLCSIEFMPNISHFVGSDIIAGIQATRMFASERYQALIDLGTNGEIVIGNKDRILCTSTAAGPAFEGINISQGMRAASGAICSVEIRDDRLTHKVIGNEKPIGLCGSGLVDAVCAFLETDRIDYAGTVTTGEDSKIPISENVGLTSKDIREFQLAKAAVRTGFEILKRQFPISVCNIEKVYLAGGLGNYLNIKNACSVGLLELASSDQLIRLNNSALMGAKQFLFNEYRNKVGDWATNIEYCSLETHPDFQDIYCENLFFMKEEESI